VASVPAWSLRPCLTSTSRAASAASASRFGPRTERLTYRLRPFTGSRPAETRSSHRPSPLLLIDPLPYLLCRATPKGYVMGGTSYGTEMGRPSCRFAVCSENTL